MKNNVLLLNGIYALIDREIEYVVANNYDPAVLEEKQWSYGVYFEHWNESPEKKQQALASALEEFRRRTEEKYITRSRFEEITNKYVEALVGNTTEEETVEYSRNVIDMKDWEIKSFGLSTEVEND